MKREPKESFSELKSQSSRLNVEFDSESTHFEFNADELARQLQSDDYTIPTQYLLPDLVEAWLETQGAPVPQRTTVVSAMPEVDIKAILDNYFALRSLEKYCSEHAIEIPNEQGLYEFAKSYLAGNDDSLGEEMTRGTVPEIVSLFINIKEVERLLNDHPFSAKRDESLTDRTKRFLGEVYAIKALDGSAPRELFRRFPIIHSIRAAIQGQLLDHADAVTIEKLDYGNIVTQAYQAILNHNRMFPKDALNLSDDIIKKEMYS